MENIAQKSLRSYGFLIPFIAGFAMFSMFFGSGNLVFPLHIGAQTEGNFIDASIGLMITGVIVPFIGLVSMLMFNGNREEFFRPLGSYAPFIFTLLMLSLLGPFGVIPRCITVAYGGIGLMFPSFPLSIFSWLFCLTIALVIWQRSRIVDIVGRFLTPFLLLGLGAIIVAGIIKASPSEHTPLTRFDSFTLGFFEGYMTMDLIAAFFFAATTATYIKQKKQQIGIETPSVTNLGLKSAIIGGGLLGVVYIGFVMMASRYAAVLDQARPEEILTIIAHHTLGEFAIPVVAITICLACVTTAVILTSLFADFLTQDVTKNKMGRQPAILITILISYALSLLGFSSIGVWLGAILQFFYPSLISLAVGNIIDKSFNTTITFALFLITLACSILWSVRDFLMGWV